jgi:hypothetical protein
VERKRGRVRGVKNTGHKTGGQSRSVRRLPFLDSFSTRDRESVERAINQQEKRHHERWQSCVKGTDQASEDLHRKFRDLLGRDKLRKVQEAIRRECLAFRERLQPPAGLNRDYAKEQKASRQRIDAFVRKLGANPQRLRKIGIEHGRRLVDGFSPADEKITPAYFLRGNLEKWKSIPPLNYTPLPWSLDPPLSIYPPGDGPDPHQWFVFQPPFFGFLFTFWDVWSSNFRLDRQLFLDPVAGWVGNEITLDCIDGDLDDAAQAVAETQIAFPFEPPTAGILHAIVDAQFLKGTHDVEVQDDFGFSSSTGVQNNFLIVSVLHSTGPDTMAFGIEPQFKWNTEGDDLSLRQQNLIYLQHYRADFYSSTPVRGGQSLIVTVGTRDVDIGAAHNMDLHSDSNFQWAISAVQVRIEP